MRFKILGALAVEAAGVPLRIQSGRVSTLLATLLLDANQIVPAERLIEAVWGWEPPPTARSQLTIIVSQLRRTLARAGIKSPVVISETAGYRASVPVAELDALLFRRLAAEGERAASAGRPIEAVDLLRSALDLWRGPALAGLDSGVVRTAAALLMERRAAVQARCVELELSLGRHSSLIADLSAQVAADPLNERCQRDLIIALYRSGRVTEALGAFQEFRRRLLDEVGIEPGRQLTELHYQILNRDPVLDAPSGPMAASPAGPGRYREGGLATGASASQPGSRGQLPGRRTAGSTPGPAMPGSMGPAAGVRDIHPGRAARDWAARPAGPKEVDGPTLVGTTTGPAGATSGPGNAGWPSGPSGATRPAGPGNAGRSAGPGNTGWPAGRGNAGRSAGPGNSGWPAGPGNSGRPAGPGDAMGPGGAGTFGGPGGGARPATSGTPSGPAREARTRGAMTRELAPPATTGYAEVVVTPRQLPPAVADFVGREPELARIRRALDEPADRRGPATVAISGLPGIGKTALAIQAGWLLAASYPEGCLHAELTSPDGEPRDPHQVLGEFLHALAVPATSIPAGRSERRGLYRSLVAQRRVLVVLDDADDEAQVRPLLPTGPGSAALVTGCCPLTGLDGAHLIALDVLPTEPAIRLLTGILARHVPERPDQQMAEQRITERTVEQRADHRTGPADQAIRRTTVGAGGQQPEHPADPGDDASDAARRVARYCDGLPLAIRVAAARVALRPDRTLTDIADLLTDSDHRLDRLAVGDRDVRRGLATTYHRLDPHSAALLRRLGSLPMAEFPGWLATPLLDAGRLTAELAIDGMVTAGLIRPCAEGPPGNPRYHAPKLVRLYARERALADDPPDTAETAYRRAYRWLLWLALRADDRVPCQLFPTADLAPDGPRPAAELFRAVDDDPVGWLAAERDLVVAAAEQAGRFGDAELAWRLAVAPSNFFHLRGHSDQWQRALGYGWAALRGTPGNDRGEATLSLSHALLLLSRAQTSEAWAAALVGRRTFRGLGDLQRAATCATVQWMAARRLARPLDARVMERTGVRRATEDLGPLGPRAAPHRAGPAGRPGPPGKPGPGNGSRR